MQEIATWDYVLEPGIRHATKYHTASTESLILSVSTLKQAKEKAIADNFGLESAPLVGYLDRLLNVAMESTSIQKTKIYLPPTARW